jgi:hypothetical protein
MAGGHQNNLLELCQDSLQSSLGLGQAWGIIEITQIYNDPSVLKDRCFTVVSLN